MIEIRLMLRDDITAEQVYAAAEMLNAYHVEFIGVTVEDAVAVHTPQPNWLPILLQEQAS